MAQPSDGATAERAEQRTVVNVTDSYLTIVVIGSIAMLLVLPCLMLISIGTTSNSNLGTDGNGPLSFLFVLELLMANIAALGCFGLIAEYKLICTPSGLIASSASRRIYTAWRCVHVPATTTVSSLRNTGYGWRTTETKQPFLALRNSIQHRRPYRAVVAIATVGLGCGFLAASPSIVFGIFGALAGVGFYYGFSTSFVPLFDPTGPNRFQYFSSRSAYDALLSLRPFAASDYDDWRRGPLGRVVGYYAPNLVVDEATDFVPRQGAGEDKDRSPQALVQHLTPFVPLWLVTGVVLLEVVVSSYLLRR